LTAAPSLTARHSPRKLAESVADRIRTAIAERGTAAIAVSGGSTPGRFFQALGKTRDIEWDKVIVTLVGRTLGR
jgi:6-phosphogluconolactonase